MQQDTPDRPEAGRHEPEGSPEAEAAATTVESDGSELDAERARWVERLQRLQADYQNYRRRSEEDRRRAREQALDSLVGELLPVVDDLERALESADGPTSGLRAGVELIRQKLLAALATVGVTPFAALGEPFDPSLHEAVGQVSSADHAADVVAEQLRTGYRMHERLLRAATVRVSSGPPAADEEP